MIPMEFPEHNIVIAKDQPEYLPLPCYQDDRVTVSKWKLSWGERFTMFFTGTLWFSQLNFGRPLQPQLPSVTKPIHLAKVNEVLERGI